MRRLLVIAFFVLLAANAAIILATSANLPLELASHFAADGRPNGWQSLASYRVWMLAFGVAMPGFIVAAMAWLPRRFPRLVNLPHRDHWLAPARRDATFAALTAFAFAIGGVATLFALGIHLTVVAANATTPPRLAGGHFVALMAAFAAAIVALVIAYHRRFRAPR